MFFKIFKRQPSVTFSWLLSYVSVLLVPIIISGYIYSETDKTVEKLINKSNTFALQRIQEQMDGTLLDVERISTQICFNDYIREMIDDMEPTEESFSYTLYKIRQELKLYTLANGSFSEMFIYFEDRDMLVSSKASVDSKEFYSSNFNSDKGYDKWIANLKNKHKGSYSLFSSMVNDQKQYESIAFIRTLPLYKQDEVVNFVIMIDKSKLLSKTNGFEKVSGGAAIIMDSDSNIITTSNIDSNIYKSLKYNDLEGKTGIFFDKLSASKMAVSYIKSGVNSWKYISLVPEAVYWDQAEYVRKLTFASLAVCIIFGGVVSYLFVRKNYKPIRDLLNLFSSKSENKYEKKGNEFKFLIEAANKSLDEKIEISRSLSEQNKGLRANFLSRLLKGYESSGVHLDDLLKSYDIKFESERFGVIVFYIKNLDMIITKNEDLPPKKCVELVQFVIKNVIEELAGQKNKGFATEVDQLMACIINFKDMNADDWLEEMDRITNEASNFLQQSYGLELMIAVSDLHETIMGIPSAYSEAVEVIEYKRVTGNENFTNYRFIAKNQKEEYIYPIEKEYQLINCIKVGDYNSAEVLLEEIFENNFNGKTPSIQIVRCMMFDMMSTMLKTVNVIGSIYKNDFFEKLNAVDSLIKCDNIGHMKNKMLDITKKVCEYVIENNDKVSYSIRDKVTEYIQQNYSDSNLGNSTIADYLGMNANYVSTAFKTQTGEGLLDYINLVRINKSKNLIDEGNKTVDEVAKSVGYTSTHTFIRVFKKYEGITPGKYKESCQRKIDN